MDNDRKGDRKFEATGYDTENTMYDVCGKRI